MGSASKTMKYVGAGVLGGPVGLGALAGSEKDETSSSSRSYLEMQGPSALEQQGQGALGRSLSGYEDVVNAGPGAQDASAATGASRDLAEMLRRMGMEGGSDPTAGDISRSQGLASSLWNPQRLALSQAFEDQNTQYSRQAALMGRSTNDPILRAKLGQEQMRQGAMLEANQGAWATQYAMGQPGQRLGFATDRANVLQGLATQALANRQNLAALGSGVMAQERSWRQAQGIQHGQQSGESGGGIKGAFAGAMATTGMLASLGSMAASGGAAGGGGAAQSAAAFPSGQGASPGALSGYNYQQPAGQFFSLQSAQPSPAVAQQPVYGSQFSGRTNYNLGYGG